MGCSYDYCEGRGFLPGHLASTVTVGKFFFFVVATLPNAGGFFWDVIWSTS